MKSLAHSVLLSFALLTASAQGALTVFGDDFEGTPPALPLEGFFTEDLPGWTKNLGAGIAGRFNADGGPSALTAWYHSALAPYPDLTDANGGEVGTMDGPTKGFFFNNFAAGYIEILIGNVEPDTLYEAVISLSGSRTLAGETPSGYSIDLISMGSSIASASGTAAEAAGLFFDDVSVSFDSSQNATYNGQQLLFRISVDDQGNYLDFDNLRLSETVVPEPAGAILLGLGSLGLLMRRRRA